MIEVWRRFGWSLLLGGWSTYWAFWMFRGHDWVAAWIFTTSAVLAFVTIVVVDFRDRRKARKKKPRSPS